MIIPISHEETTVRRLPWVTFGFMASCTAVLILIELWGDAETYARWGLIPKYPNFSGLLTHMFVHGGSAHLIGNVLILFLAGPPLEDRWGRPFFAGFYVVAGVFAGGFYTLMTPGSQAPLVGASGAIAALMGASLVRFWSTNIRFFYFFWAFRVFRGTFWAPVWAILPLWFLNNFVMARLADELGVVSQVAYWCHVGGFAFGVAFAYGMKHWEIEGRYINPAIESLVTVAHNAVIDEAMELRIQGQPESAYELLAAAAGEHPEDPDVVSAFWELACERKRTEDAVSLVFGLVKRSLMRGERDLAVQHWEQIAERAPTARCDRQLLLRLIPVLIEKEKSMLAVRALRKTLDPRLGELSSPMACKLLALARGVDPPTALIAARRALEAGRLHGSDREQVEVAAAELEQCCAALPDFDPAVFGREWTGADRDLSIPLDDDSESDFIRRSESEEPAPAPKAREIDATGSLVESDFGGELVPDSEPLDRWATPLPAASIAPNDNAVHEVARDASDSVTRAHGLKVVEARPLEIADDCIVLQRSGGGSGRVAYHKVQALAVAAVKGLASKPVLLIDLIVNWNDPGEGPLQLIRLRSDVFDVRKLVPHAASSIDAFRVLQEQLLARTGAVPLPDRDAVRGRPLRTYSDIVSYQREVLRTEG
jgi:membrane associated rhomboid family serine protease